MLKADETLTTLRPSPARRGAKAKSARKSVPVFIPEIAVRPALSDARAKALPVIGDGMSPTFTPYDYVLMVPCATYEGIGVYVVQDRPDAGHAILRRQREGDRGVRLSLDNPHHRRTDLVSLTDFARIVRGKVIARVSPFDMAAFRDAFFS